MKKTFAIEYYERNQPVCWTLKAETAEEAKNEFLYEVAAGNVDNFNYEKGIIAIDECV